MRLKCQVCLLPSSLSTLLGIMSSAMTWTPPAPSFPMGDMHSCNSLGNPLLPSFLAGRHGSWAFWGISCISNDRRVVTDNYKFWPDWMVCWGNHGGCKLLNMWPTHWLFMKVTPSFASLNGADEPCLAVTIKFDGPVLTYSSLWTGTEHKAALNFKKKKLRNCRSSWYTVTVLALPFLRVWSLLLWDMLTCLAN